MLTVTDVVEHVFCPKFTYFCIILGLEQYEQKRGTVLAGRKLHSKHEDMNKAYMPQKLSGKKIIGRTYYSTNLGISGKIDEAVETENEIILVERKYSDFTDLRDTLKVQLGLLALLVEENTGKPVKRSLVIFSKKHRIVKEFLINKDIREFAMTSLSEVKKTIIDGVLPSSKFDNRCLNCCFRKICPVGSLNNDK